MGNYVENNLGKNETIVKKSRPQRFVSFERVA